jgi:large subunit ribosomal protein L33
MREIILLGCAECKNRNYTMKRNKKTNSGKLEIKKFCKACGKHTVHKETKP